MLEAPRPLALIVAWAGPDRVIGRQGALPWHLPEDLQRFRRLTWGHAILMGRATFQSIGRPLPGRRNLVLTQRRDFCPPGVEVFASLDAALDAAYSGDPQPYVIGGARLYEQTLPLATRLDVTEIAQPHAGDVHFPGFAAQEFTLLSEEAAKTPGVRFLTYVRRGHA